MWENSIRNIEMPILSDTIDEIRRYGDNVIREKGVVPFREVYIMVSNLLSDTLSLLIGDKAYVYPPLHHPYIDELMVENIHDRDIVVIPLHL